MKTVKILIETTQLIGLSLPYKTTNDNGQSNIDCGNLWQQFEAESRFAAIPGKNNDEILAVYHDYEGDYTEPFSYFIGCKVKKDTAVPDGMDSITIPSGNYQKLTASGEMPNCIAKAWKEIWGSDIARAYRADFEVYDERSQNWNDAEVDIFISVE